MSDISEYKIVKESLDARDKGDIKYVYTVDFSVEGEFPFLEKTSAREYQYPVPGGALKSRPVIVGFGPCGMFAALILSECGYAPLVIERGAAVEERIKDVERFRNEGFLNEESNVQFGEGGAGTFSDGKLVTGIKDIRVRKVFEELAAAGAGDDILYKQKPHVGTDVLRVVVRNIREKIIKNGGEILFNTRLDDIVSENNRLTGVVISDREIEAEILILATGHSARGTIKALHKAGVFMEQKPFSIGVRIEHPQEIINEAQYGKKAARGLPPAEYKLSQRCCDGRGVYTFCMCPGGEVIIASSEKGGIVTNGMSFRSRDGEFANSAILVDVRTSDFESSHPLSGFLFQEKFEREAFKHAGGKYEAPMSTWEEFAGRGADAIPVIDSLPPFAVNDIIEAMPYFARRIKGFDAPETRVYAVESRSSSPVRITRNERLQSNIAGIYPGGEGAGYAGGIISAAVDGIRIAEEIIKNFHSAK